VLFAFFLLDYKRFYLGCEYYGYNSDITRTWPISGRFTGPQIALYEAVLDVQLQLIKLLVERPTLNQLFTEMCRILGNNLKELCFLPSSASAKELAAVSIIPILF
jgi:Xaa-Pro aminopeptidase